MVSTPLERSSSGLLQVTFAPDGNFLFTGARTDSEIWCWDVRYQSGIVYKLLRDTPTTNQRISFDIEPCGKHLASGVCFPKLASLAMKLHLQYLYD